MLALFFFLNGCIFNAVHCRRAGSSDPGPVGEVCAALYFRSPHDGGVAQISECKMSGGQAHRWSNS